jgi:ribulose-phosphate 3-epimerase
MNKYIIPAIMPERFDDIQSYVSLVRNRTHLIQIDIMDGKYAPERTWPFFYQNDYRLQDLQKEDEGFPYWENINYELDLMIERPEEVLDTWLSLGASRVVFHYGSIHDWSKIHNIDPVMRNFTRIGIAVTIYDNLDDVCAIIEKGTCDYIQVMGIARIGYQGEPFDSEALGIISHLRKKYPDMLISVDGGVSLQTIGLLKEVGANEFVSGSGVFDGGDAVENIQELEKALRIKE